MSDSETFAAISEIASALTDATDGDEYHAVRLIHDLANGRTTPEDARAALAELALRHL